MFKLCCLAEVCVVNNTVLQWIIKCSHLFYIMAVYKPCATKISCLPKGRRKCVFFKGQYQKKTPTGPKFFDNPLTTRAV